MSEINRILDQMDRAYSGEAWHGPDLKQLLEGLSAEDASKHPVPGAHSIWELVNHFAAWNSIVQRKSKGERSRSYDGNRLAAGLGSERNCLEARAGKSRRKQNSSAKLCEDFARRSVGRADSARKLFPVCATAWFDPA